MTEDELTRPDDDDLTRLEEGGLAEAEAEVTEEKQYATPPVEKIIVVTGGAGFIGSNLVRHLNDKGRENILIVDDLADPLKLGNINTLRFQDYCHKDKFIELFQFMSENNMVESVYHLGAESDVGCTDGNYLMANNYQYTCNLMDICYMQKIPMVYASSAAVYGEQQQEWAKFDSTSDDYTPLSYYALTKLMQDRYSRKFLSHSESTIIGLRYFNVYSDGEYEKHKGGMKSPHAWMKEQYTKSGTIKLFIGSEYFSLDFVDVKQAVWMTVNAMSAGKSGVYNIGSEVSSSFLSVAESIVEDPEHIQYIPMPEEMAERYQTFTLADMDNCCFSITTRP